MEPEPGSGPPRGPDPEGPGHPGGQPPIPTGGQRAAPGGLKVFLVIWLGQTVSLFGSGLSRFGLGVWVYQETGSVTQFGLIALAAALPALLVAPVAGALVDRWDRRWTLLVSDGVAAASTLALLALILTDGLSLWQIYLLAAVNAAAAGFQGPAFGATTALLVPKAHLGRAAGMAQAGRASSQIAAPLVAGALLAPLGLGGLVALDLASFTAAVGTLLAVRIPRPRRSAAGEAGRGSLLAEARYGLSFILERPGFLALLVLFAGVNFSHGMVQVLLTPLVLSFASAAALGQVLSAAGAGMLVGSIVMSVWGGPRRRVNGILGFLVLGGLLLAAMGLRASVPLILSLTFGYLFFLPIINGSSQAIWQSKVEPDVQGRVFAIRQMVATCSMPLSFLLAGPLADYVFEPLLTPGGALAGSAGRVLGVGPGRGIGLLLVVLGLIMVLAVALASRYPRLRRLEEEVPDAVGEPVPAAAAESAPAVPGRAVGGMS